MDRFLKYTLAGTSTLVVIILFGAGYLTATFNPNDYTEKIILAVKENNDRTLRIEGNIELSFFPNVGAELGELSLSEVGSNKEFVSIEKMRASLALLPLLSKQVMVDEITVSGLHASFAKQKDGSSNIDDLLAPQKKPLAHTKTPRDNRQITFDIAAISVEKASFLYHDAASGRQYSIKDLSLTSGRIASNIPVAVALTAVVQANEPKLDIVPHLQTTLTFDLEKRECQLADMKLQISGTALDINDLMFNLNGDITANLKAKKFAFKGFSFKATGRKAKDTFKTSLLMPTLNLVDDGFSGDTLTGNATLTGDPDTVTASISLPKFAGDAKSFTGHGFSLDFEVKQPTQTVTLKLNSNLLGNFIEQHVAMDYLSLSMNASGAQLPRHSLEAAITGGMRANIKDESAQADIVGNLAQSQIKAKLGVKGFSRPALQFDIEVDQFDTDSYLPKRSTSTEKKTAKETERAFDLSVLRELDLSGRLHIGSLKLANLRSTEVKLELKAHNGHIDVNPLSANLYDGNVKGSLAIDVTSTPKITLTQNLYSINVAPLTKDAANFDTLEGTGDVGLDLSTQGDTVGAFKKMMNGTLSLNLADGAIKGINIGKQIRDAQNILGIGSANIQPQSTNSAEKTDFTELKATFAIINGVAHNDDLSLKSPLLRLSGAGDIDIASDSINYLAKATLVATLKGQGGKDNLNGIMVPVRFKGPFSDLKYTLDFAGLAGEIAKQKAEAVKEGVKTKVQDQINTHLQGFFR